MQGVSEKVGSREELLDRKYRKFLFLSVLIRNNN